MSDPSSCPNNQPHVGDRQVDVLAGFTLRNDLGISEPSDEVWNRLHLRLTAPPVVAPAPPAPPSRGVLWQRALLTTVPRMSSVGAALVLLMMFVNNSIHLMPPAYNPMLTTSVNQPVNTIGFVLDKVGSHDGLAPAPTEETNSTELADPMPHVVIPVIQPLAPDVATGPEDLPPPAVLHDSAVDEHDSGPPRAQTYPYLTTWRR